jgi:hypothetical protein
MSQRMTQNNDPLLSRECRTHSHACLIAIFLHIRSKIIGKPISDSTSYKLCNRPTRNTCSNHVPAFRLPACTPVNGNGNGIIAACGCSYYTHMIIHFAWPITSIYLPTSASVPILSLGRTRCPLTFTLFLSPLENNTPSSLAPHLKSQK